MMQHEFPSFFYVQISMWRNFEP